MSGFEPPRYTLHHCIHAHEFKEQRPTVVLVLTEGNKVLLVQSSKDPEAQTWIPPQGGIIGHDGTLIRAALREAEEELRLTEQAMYVHRAHVLGEYHHRGPAERSHGLPKHLFFVGIPLVSSSQIRLNTEENRDYTWVRSHEELCTAMMNVATRRPGKFEATCCALDVAHRHGLISWGCGTA